MIKIAKQTPVLYMLSSTLSLSITGLLAKFLSESFDVSMLTLLRFVLPTVIIFSILIFSKINLPSWSTAKVLVVRAFCIGACQLCFIYALNALSLVESVVLFGTGPIFIAILEKLLFGIKLQGSTVLALLATFVGVVMLANNGSEFILKPELLIGLLAGFFNAGSQLSLHKASKSELSGLETNAWTFGLASLMLLPLAVVNQWSKPLEPVLWAGINTVTIIVLMVMALLIINTQVSRYKAYKTAENNSQLAPLIYSNLAFTALWQVLIFDVTFSDVQLAGLSLIVVTSVATTIMTPKSHRYSQKDKQAVSVSAN